MPIKIPKDLPAGKLLQKENIFIINEKMKFNSIGQINLLILNLMPLKEETELQLLRSLSNTPLQVNITFLRISGYQSKNTHIRHLNKFYLTFDQVKDRTFDGLIITGAPVENLDFEEVHYWDELKKIMDWTKENVKSTYYICWAAQAALYHHYGVNKYTLEEKCFGIFEHTLHNRKTPLLRGFDDVFLAPHSRYTTIKKEDIKKISQLEIISYSEDAGVFIVMSKDGKEIFVTGHPEYDRLTLDQEYKRDLSRGISVQKPKNYYHNNNKVKPTLTWRAHANTLYINWLNYYVYNKEN